MRRLLLGLWLAVTCSALVSVTSVADISGDGNAHQIAASGAARWIQFVCPSANSSSVRIGDSTITTSIGLPCAPGASFFMPPLPVLHSDGPNSNPVYDLSKIYYLVQSGDKVSITRANP